MINKVYSILSLNLLILISPDARASNITFINNQVNSLQSKVNKSQHYLSSIIPQSRGERGIHFNPFVEHEYHDSIAEPQYIIKLIAPPRKSRKSAGVAELLLVLAPLAAIPLIGSAALTTFTTMFATTGGYGRRRKRDLLTRELLSRSWSEVQPRDDDYVSQKLIGDQHNVGLESLLATTGAHINTNEKRHTFPANDLIQQKIDRFGTQTTSKSQLSRLNGAEEDLNNWKPIDLGLTDRTGVHKSSPIMSNTSESLENRNYKSIRSFGSLVKGFENRSEPTISTDQSYLERKGSLDKREPELREIELTEVEPIAKQQYKDLFQKSAYRSKTDIRTDRIVDNNNTFNKMLAKRVAKKSGEKSSFDNKVPKMYKNFNDMSDSVLRFGEDLITEESDILTKRANPSNRDTKSSEEDKPETDRFEFNTWIPFLSNPYLVDMGRGDGKREIHDLDIIQKYLNAMGRPDYNDEIIATYLSCNGMLSASNQCLERLTCQFSDSTSGLKQLEKDVSSLVIYSLLKNSRIDTGFKSRLQRAAFFGKDNPGKCNFYNCPKNTLNKTQNKRR